MSTSAGAAARVRRDPRRAVAARRRGHALAAGAALAFALGAVLGSPAAQGPERGSAGVAAALAATGTPPPARLPVRQLAGQAIVLSFSGPTLPRYVRDILRQGRAAGVILFGDNVRSPGQLRALTGAVQRAAGGRALVMTDQEGGAVRIVRFAAPATGQRRLRDPTRAAAAARAAARDLHALGINVDLAPVVDAPGAGRSALRARAYAGSPGAVGAQAAAAVRAFTRGRVAATAKHYPGLGSAAANTDDAPVTIAASRGRLFARDVAPFRAAIAADVPLIMVGHARYPSWDRRDIASQSRPILGPLLRRTLGYRGAVVTDSLEARAVLARSSVQTAALRSLRAGADLALLTGPGSYPIVYRRLLREAGASAAFRARLADAAARVGVLRRRLGLTALPGGG